jgi:hypothetical protein
MQIVCNQNCYSNTFCQSFLEVCNTATFVDEHSQLHICVVGWIQALDINMKQQNFQAFRYCDENYCYNVTLLHPSNSRVTRLNFCHCHKCPVPGYAGLLYG